MQRKPHLNVLYLATLLMLILVAVTMFTSVSDGEQTLGYSQVVSYFKANQVTGFSLDLNTGIIELSLKEGSVDLPPEKISVSPECIKCGQCIDVCPAGCLSYRKQKK